MFQKISSFYVGWKDEPNPYASITSATDFGALAQKFTISPQSYTRWDLGNLDELFLW